MTDVFLFYIFAPALLAWGFVASRIWNEPKIWYYLIKNRTITRAEARAKRFKPFDCEMCMGFWIGMGWNLADYSFMTALVYAFAVSFFTCLLTRWAKTI
jgi:hypothetical protein